MIDSNPRCPQRMERFRDARMSCPVVCKYLPPPGDRMAETLVKHRSPRSELINRRGPHPILPVRPDLAGSDVVERDQNNVTGQFRLEAIRE